MELLFEGPRRKLIEIALRNGAVLASHSVPVPITIQCLAGEGALHDGEPRESIALAPGVFVTMESSIVHDSAPARGSAASHHGPAFHS
ncbi:MAG: hypothetical protein FJW31_20355 [Acidobacteria bacterium]|nr:hypothetical protein [Acidobacteriota bacterium]